MRSELSWIEVNAADPPRDEARILARGQRPIRASATRKQALPRLEAAAAKIVVERLPGLLSQFEPDGPSGLLLANVGPVDGVAVGRHVIDIEGNEITTTQLAVDGQIEHRQIAHTLCKLQIGPNCPDVTWSQWRFGAGDLALIPRRSRMRPRQLMTRGWCRPWSVSLVERPPRHAGAHCSSAIPVPRRQGDWQDL
jgi:hypothetical protein